MHFPTSQVTCSVNRVLHNITLLFVKYNRPFFHQAMRKNFLVKIGFLDGVVVMSVNPSAPVAWKPTTVCRPGKKKCPRFCHLRILPTPSPRCQAGVNQTNSLFPPQNKIIPIPSPRCQAGVNQTNSLWSELNVSGTFLLTYVLLLWRPLKKTVLPKNVYTPCQHSDR